MGEALGARDRSSSWRDLTLDPDDRDHVRGGDRRGLSGEPAAPAGRTSALDRGLRRINHVSSRSAVAVGRDAGNWLSRHPSNVCHITEIEPLSRLSTSSGVSCCATVGVQKRVLVVDDDASIRELLSSALEDDGYEVVPAVNGADALSVCERWRPDVIVLDLMMPVMDG